MARAKLFSGISWAWNVWYCYLQRVLRLSNLDIQLLGARKAPENGIGRALLLGV
jgi:hypothetical protein